MRALAVALALLLAGCATRGPVGDTPRMEYLLCGQPGNHGKLACGPVAMVQP